jgi:hypothetical protein
MVATAQRKGAWSRGKGIDAAGNIRYHVVVGYFVVTFALAQFVSREKAEVPAERRSTSWASA